MVPANPVQQAASVALVTETMRKLEATGIHAVNIDRRVKAEELFLNSFLAWLTPGGLRYDDGHQNLRNAIGTLEGEYDVVILKGHSGF